MMFDPITATPDHYPAVLRDLYEDLNHVEDAIDSINTSRRSSNLLHEIIADHEAVKHEIGFLERLECLANGVFW